MNWFIRNSLKWLSVQCHLPIIGVSSRRSQSHIHNEKKTPTFIINSQLMTRLHAIYLDLKAGQCI